MTPDFVTLRRNMVDCQLRTYDVTDRAVLAAMDAVPRELFVPQARRDVAYIDQPVALDAFGAPDRALLAPMTSGRMLQTLNVQPGQSFFDYACGTGYTSAVAAALGAHVTAYDVSDVLRSAARTALAACGSQTVDVVDTLPRSAFDLVFVNGGCAALPPQLAQLMADGGKLVIVEGSGRAGRVMLYQNSAGTVGGRQIFDAAVPYLAEFRPEPVFAL
jgi:protein-L-isoaspartate(D-aspartate) O-methyltransferase